MKYHTIRKIKQDSALGVVATILVGLVALAVLGITWGSVLYSLTQYNYV